MNDLMPINTVEDIAKYLIISKSTVYRLVESKKIKSIRLLGKTRITREAVEEFINQ